MAKRRSHVTVRMQRSHGWRSEGAMSPCGCSGAMDSAAREDVMPRRDVVAEVRKICLSLPEVDERLSHGAPTFFVRGKKSIATVWDDHHGDSILGLICAAPPGVQQQLVDEEPDRFYVPAYVGGRGWIGVRLDRKPDWGEIEQILVEAYTCVAPAKLVAQLNEQ